NPRRKTLPGSQRQLVRPVLNYSPDRLTNSHHPMNRKSLTQSVLMSSASLLGALTLCNSASASQFVDGPDDQEAQAGTSVALELEPRVAHLAYQWYRQWPDHSSELSGETNSTLSFASVQISDVGLYFCRVTHGNQTEYTPLATLFVTTGSGGS